MARHRSLRALQWFSCIGAVKAAAQVMACAIGGVAMARTVDAGYGGAHVKLRKKIQKEMDAGKVFYCWRCIKPVDPQPDCWDLGHDDNDRSKWTGPEHISCNRAVQRHKAGNVVDESRLW